MNDPGESVGPTEAMRRELADNLADLATYRMPFGRFRGRPLHTLPWEYLHWFAQRPDGFPDGRLGELMSFVYHTKSDGAESVFAHLPKSP